MPDVVREGATYDIVIKQGASFKLDLTYEDGDGNPINLTGATARMQIRSGGDALVTLSSPSDGITLGGSSGTIAVRIWANETDSLPVVPAVYDLEVHGSATDVDRLLQGRVTIVGQVTT
jgi:hypothetical protein